MTREDFIKTLIKNQGMTIKDFANKIGIPYTTILSMLNGSIGGASVDTVIKICLNLGITVEELEDYNEQLAHDLIRGVGVRKYKKHTNIGKRIKGAREKANLTQKQLAVELGLPQNTIANWETGKMNPDYDYLIKIAILFNVHLDYLLDAGLCSQREVVKKYRSTIEHSVFEIIKKLMPDKYQEYVNTIKKMDFEEFLIRMSKMIAKVTYNQEDDKLFIFYYADDKPIVSDNKIYNDDTKGNDKTINSSQNEQIVECEASLLEKYRNLDDHGKEAVDTILHIEHKRCLKENEPQPEAGDDIQTFRIASRNGANTITLNAEERKEFIEMTEKAKKEGQDFTGIF